MELTLEEKQKKQIIQIARHRIEHSLGFASTADLSVIEDPLFKSELYGSFVTLTIQGDLRGCIGYITPIAPLKEQIELCAESAAFNDYRFSPLRKEEYDSISVEISLLSPIEIVKNIADIVVGRDGLIVSKGHHQGLLLPQVASEYGWNREEFLDHTCMKAGLTSGCWKEDNVIIKKFSAYVFGENNGN